MKVVHAGIFEDHDLGGDIIFEKGLQQNGCQVTRFSYSPDQPVDDSTLPEIALGHDLLFVGKGEGFSPAVFREIRKNGTAIALWYGDVRLQPEPWLCELLKETDFFFMSSSGELLHRYHQVGGPKLSAYYLNPVDPDLIKRYQAVGNEKTIDVLFTATNYAFAGKERRAVAEYLRSRPDTMVKGWSDPPPFLKRYFPSIFGEPQWPRIVRGADYVTLIKSAKIGVGVSPFQDVARYSSDRLQHYLTFGTFFIPWKFPEIELLFSYGKDLVWYQSVEELDKKLNYFLQEPQEREMIAKAAQTLFAENYNTKAIVAMMLDIIRDGTSDRFSWIEIIK